MSDPTIWVGPATTVPVVNANGNTYEEVQVATAAQTLFTLLTFQYTPGNKSIFVLKNGVMLRRGVDYAETSATQVTLATGATVGDKLTFIAWAIAVVNPPVTLNGVPAGGTVNQVLAKLSGSDYDDAWVDPATLSYLLDKPTQLINLTSTDTVIDLTPYVTATRNISIASGSPIIGQVMGIQSGQVWLVRFNNTSCELVHSFPNLVTPMSKDIYPGVGDTCIFRGTGANTCQILAYTRASVNQEVPNVNEFRLSLVSGNAVPGDTTGSNIYMTPYFGNKISMHDGYAWNVYDSVERTLPIAGKTIGLPYDVFVWSLGGAAVVEDQAWTNSTTRAVTLTTDNGILVKSGGFAGDPLKKYLGTYVPTAANAIPDTLANRYLWNYYNRVQRNGYILDGTANWNYSLAAYRQANANTANQFNFVVGIAEDYVSANIKSTMTNNTAGAEGVSAIGYDSVAGPATGNVIGDSMIPVAAYKITLPSVVTLQPSAGKHYLSWLEALAVAVGVGTWYGGIQSGMNVHWKA